MSIYDHPSALALAAEQGNSASGDAIREHLTVCLACRVRAHRLRHMTMPDSPNVDAVARILEASTPGPGVLGRLTTTRDEGPPRQGEIWRIGREEALLVWIRRALSDAVDVIPAVLDIELADQESVILPADSTPLGMPLALLTGVRGHVGFQAFLERVGFVDASVQVHEAMSAAREGRMPQGIDVGLAIEAEDDQRIEYRQVIADLLADLAPSRWAEADPSAGPVNGPSDELVALLSQDLPNRYFDVSILPCPHHHIEANDEMSLVICTRVTYLDTSVIVALLVGSILEDALLLGSLADACLEVVRLEPDADAVAVAGRSVGWPTVVLRVPQLRTAFEPPGGPPVAPQLAIEPMPIVDALAKFLDGQATAWEATEPAASKSQSLNLEQLSLRSAADAVAGIVAEGRRARTTAKKFAWTNLSDDLIPRIAASIASIAGSEPTDAVLDDLLGRGKP